MRIFGEARHITLAALMLVSCGDDEEKASPAPPTVVAAPVAVVAEQRQVEAIGSARAATAAELYAEAAGAVVRVRFAAGDYVKSGQSLVELDSRREKLAVDLAKVAVAEASQLLGRYRRIEDTGALSASQIEAGVTSLQSAEIELEQAQVALADRTVRAPFSGHMGLPQIDRGDRITPTTLIATIDDRSTLFVDFPAPEGIFQRLQPGKVVTLSPYADPGRSIDARVRAVDSSVSVDTRSFTVRTAVPNRDDSLRPGMSFRASFESPGEARPAIPEAAVVWGGDGSYLWAVRDGTARRVPITIVERRDGQVLVSGAVRPDERIIVEGVQKVRDGQKVQLVRAARPDPLRATVPRQARPRPTAG